MKDRTLDCEQALRLLATYLDQELSGVESRSVEDHLERCRTCWSRAEFERRLKVQVQEIRNGDPPPELKARIRGLLGEFRAGG